METDLYGIEKFFWDVDFNALSWDEHHNFIVRRLLQEGDLASIRWLRARLGDDALREWLMTRSGRGLSPRQIRYWALILDIEPSIADTWVKRVSMTPWGRNS